MHALFHSFFRSHSLSTLLGRSFTCSLALSLSLFLKENFTRFRSFFKEKGRASFFLAINSSVDTVQRDTDQMITIDWISIKKRGTRMIYIFLERFVPFAFCFLEGKETKESVLSRLCAYNRLINVRAFERWTITSTSIEPVYFELLKSVIVTERIWRKIYLESLSIVSYDPMKINLYAFLAYRIVPCANSSSFSREKIRRYIAQRFLCTKPYESIRKMFISSLKR